MKTTKVIRKPQTKLNTQILDSNPKNEQVVLGRRSLRPMKSMMGVKSLRPQTADQMLKGRFSK